MADMKKAWWIPVLVLAGCTAGTEVYPEIEAAGMRETVETAYLDFSVTEAAYVDDALHVVINTENTFVTSETVFDTDFWLYTGEGKDVLFPEQPEELYLASGESGTLELVFRCEEAKAYVLGYTDVSAEGVFGATYYVRVRGN